MGSTSVPPALSAEIPSTVRFDPDTTRATDSEGNTIEFDEDGAIIFGAGSITLSIPVSAPAGVEVATFVDTASGISIVGTDVEVPITDPNTGEVLLRLVGTLETVLTGTEDGDQASGRFESLRLLTVEKRQDLSLDNPLVGSLGVSLDVELEFLPDDVNLELTIKGELNEQQRLATETEVADSEDKIIADEAGTIIVQADNLSNETDIGEVNISVKVGFDWIIKFGTDNVRIAHDFEEIDEQGNTVTAVELLDTTCEGPDANLEFTCTGTTTNGFSNFTLLAVATAPTTIVAQELVITPELVEPGESVTTSVDLVNDGGISGSFSVVLKVKGPGDLAAIPISAQSVTLAKGEQQTVRFFVPTEEEGRFEIQIQDASGAVLTGAFDVFKKADPANIGFSDLIIDPKLARPGESVTVSMDVQNSGDEGGTVGVEFRVNQVLKELRSVFVDGNATTTVTFEFVPPTSDTYTVQLIDRDELVDPSDGTFVAEVFVKPAEFKLDTIPGVPLVSLLQALPDEALSITFLLFNNGELPGDITLDLLIGGQLVESRTLTVSELSLEQGIFTTTAPSVAGTYSVVVQAEGVESVQDEFIVISVPDAEGFILIESIQVSSTTVAPGDSVTVTLVLRNPTSFAAEDTFSVNLDGAPFDSVVVALGPGESATRTFDITESALGTHEVDIDGDILTLTTFEVEAPATPADLSLGGANYNA